MDQPISRCLPGLESTAIASLAQRRFVTFASVALLVWDCFRTAEDEVQHVWRYPPSATKVAYVAARYIPLAGQFVNFYLVFGPLYAGVGLQDAVICTRWWGSLLAIGSTLIMSLDFVLMLRIHALYQKSIRISALLVMLFGCLTFVQILKQIDFLPSLAFDCVCDSVGIYSLYIYYCIVVLAVQFPIGALLLAKHRNIRTFRSQLMRVINRDGVLLVGLTFAFFSAMIAHSSIKESYQVHIVVILPISLVSIGCCRTSLHIIAISAQEEVQREAGVQESYDLSTFSTVDRPSING
ncbi:hypothetical protein BJ165DRAFT_1505691 [Panaeolus papilionaceus]|nr:hypothetical protein BJ165DRAFT_1505691 [Panaeolus papilionaceus]